MSLSRTLSIGSVAAPLLLSANMSFAQGIDNQEEDTATNKNTATVQIPIEEYEKLKREAEGTKTFSQKSLAEMLEDDPKKDPMSVWEKYDFLNNRVVRMDSGKSLDGTIGDRVAQEIQLLDALSNDPIKLEIFSPGGSVFDGFRILNAMAEAESPIHTYCQGMVASMGMIIFVSGDHRIAGLSCRGLFHEVGSGTRGQSSEQIEQFDRAIGLEMELYEIVSRNSGLSIEDIQRIGRQDIFYTSEEMIRLGLADEMDGQLPRTLVAGIQSVPAELEPSAKIQRSLEFKSNSLNPYVNTPSVP